MPTFYLRPEAGSCGATLNLSLSETQGSSNSSTDVEGIVTQDEDVWDVVENRLFRVGAWTIYLDVLVGTGGMTDNKVRVFVDRRDSSCIRQENIFDQTSAALTQGATNHITLVQDSFIGRSFAVDDKLSVSIVDAGGTDTKEILFGGGGTDYDSRLKSPGVTPRRMVSFF